ncbi:MAG: type I-E CRISPR-associated endonuclease Cas1e [Spirochaetia bacterium]|nr:type I-E CRISPR-associated endonuclease Cas1e [Spirochaetia bacterium]
MANRDLQEIPKFSNKWSFMYFEKGHIEQYRQSISYEYLDKIIPVPIETLSLLMLGPGTTITHAAVKTVSESRCCIAWVGENGVKFYGFATPSTYSAKNLLKQVECLTDEEKKMQIVRQMYAMRFTEILPADITLEQLRGKEGSRVRKSYKELSEKFGIEWHGRRYNQANWGGSDPVNRALSAANSCLYGLCQAAIVSLGCSTALGFIHSGKQLSFVYDIADLYKVEMTVPIAFEASAAGAKAEATARYMCRDHFREKKLLKKIISDIMGLLYGDSYNGEHDDIAEGADVAVNY